MEIRGGARCGNFFKKLMRMFVRSLRRGHRGPPFVDDSIYTHSVGEMYIIWWVESYSFSILEHLQIYLHLKLWKYTLHTDIHSLVISPPPP